MRDAYGTRLPGNILSALRTELVAFHPSSDHAGMTLALPADTLDPISGNSDLPLAEKPRRIVSVDAMRGFVMLTMIYVNDLNGDVAPWWMKHWSETGFAFNGLTFVDLVFPSFLFLVGMSIHSASRRAR